MPLGSGAACDPKAGPPCSIAEGLWCKLDTKVCAPLKVAKAGEACGYDAKTVAFTVCSGNAPCTGASGATPGTCATVGKAGEACGPAGKDADQDGCMRPARCSAGTCVIPGPNCK